MRINFIYLRHEPSYEGERILTKDKMPLTTGSALDKLKGELDTRVAETKDVTPAKKAIEEGRETAEKFEAIKTATVASINAKERQYYPTIDEAKKDTLAIFHKIHKAFSSQGMAFPVPSEADVDLNPPESGFYKQLVAYFDKHDCYFQYGYNSVNKDGGETHVITFIFRKIERKEKRDLKKYIPSSFTGKHFDAANTKAGEVPVVSLGDSLVKKNGLFAINPTSRPVGTYGHGAVIIYPGEIKDRFPEKDDAAVKRFIEADVIPNEMGHAYGELLGIKNMGLSEVVSDYFSMNALDGPERVAFLQSRLDVGGTIDSYGPTAILVAPAQKYFPAIGSDKAVRDKVLAIWGGMIKDEIAKELDAVQEK